MKINMRITVFSLTIGLVLIFLFSCLKKQEAEDNPNRVYFTIPAADRKISVPIQFHDSITANLTFDTGISGDTLGIYLDSILIAQHPRILSKKNPDMLYGGGVAWTKLRYPSSRYNTPLTVKIGNNELRYDIVDVMNWRRYMGNNLSDGLFTIPQNDTTHVWELNYEHSYLEIHPAETFTMPGEALVLPIKETDQARFLVELPVKIQCADGDTLTINRTFFIDTGIAWDVALMCRAEELEFFNKKEAVWTSYLDSYFRHYEVKATLFDHFVIDSLRIYTFDRPNYVSDNYANYLIGLHFLKHFNVFFDLKNQRLGLQPIKNFQRIVNPSYRRFHHSTKQMPEGKIIITDVANYQANYYKTAGLREGDELVSINNKNLQEISEADFQKDTLIYGIIRNKKNLKLIIPVDKNEVQGD
jgi:hypothetical protein